MECSAIVYTSATGFTARYAALLSQAADLPAYSLQDAEAPAAGSTVLYLGWLRAGRIMGLRKAMRRYQVVAVCPVGMMEGTEADMRKLLQDNHLETLPCFYLRGGYAPDRLWGLSKLMMAPMKHLILRHPPQNAAQETACEALLHGADWVDAEALGPVLHWLNTHYPHLSTGR